MKLTLILFIFINLIATINTARAHTSPEFEGRIFYSVDFELKNKSFKKKDLHKFYGVTKEFVYKHGNYKWKTYKGILQFEIYNAALDSLHAVSKFAKNDTLYYYNFYKTTDRVLSTDSIEYQTICGIKCQGIKFRVTDDVNQQMTRTMYFPIDSLIYPKEYYKYQNLSSNNVIYATGKSIPLKLILDIKSSPFRLIYTAKRIEHGSVDDSEFYLDSTKPKKIVFSE